jgi:hypothetical protein
MKKSKRFYYRPQAIVPGYIFFILLSLILLWSPFPSRYFRFLEHPPGIYIIYFCVIIYAFVLIWKLPTFSRSLLRIPAVEFDGNNLLVRGWENRTFTISPDHKISIRDDGTGKLIVSSSTNKPAIIYLRHIEQRSALVSFLNGLSVI